METYIGLLQVILFLQIPDTSPKTSDKNSLNVIILERVKTNVSLWNFRVLN